MMRSLFSGVSGLKTHQTKMDVIGNNISNVNTVAFKSSSTTFSDLMYQTTSQASGATATRGGTNAKQIGLGVTNGATKISITSSGAAQSTGDALDIRLTDSKTTNFFIVSNGTENLFTRAGSFYIDGNGNLAMTTTGYLVMGWQVDKTTGNIQKNTVSALRVMSAENQTSSPEATTNATFSGVIDKNDTDVTSSSGYVRSLTLYDSLGYSYTAKFSIQVEDATKGDYTIELTSLLDADGNDILSTYLDADGNCTVTADEKNAKLANIFGTSDTKETEYSLASGFTYTTFSDGSTPVLTYTSGSDTYKLTSTVAAGGISSDTKYTFTKCDASTGEVLTGTDAGTKDFTVYDIFGVSSSNLPTGTTFTTTLATATSDKTASLTLSVPTVMYGLSFNTKTGTLSNLTSGTENTSAGTTAVLHTSLLGPNTDPTADVNAALSDITIDFSQLLNYDNGGTSTVTVSRGDLDGTTGAGKKLGNMTGLSISSDGTIYGSYDNGNTVLLGQIAVAQFANASGLEEMGDNCYQTTLNSGEFDGIGVDVSADGSSMATGQLEMSNVDLSSEFTEMIVTQRGFQANSRIITVSDTLLEELINLKR